MDARNTSLVFSNLTSPRRNTEITQWLSFNAFNLYRYLLVKLFENHKVHFCGGL